MLPHEPGLRVAVGVSGSGKSYTQRIEALAASERIPVIVVDTMKEWAKPDGSSIIPASHADIAAGANDINVAIKHVANGKRLIILQPPDEQILATARAAAVWAQQYPGVAGLVIPEAHNVAPVTHIPIEIDRIATAWRHHKVAMWCDTQRIARLNHAITDNARELRIFAQWSELDLKRVYEIGKAPLVEAINEAAYRLAPPDEGGKGEAGWHVRLGMRRVPPFELIRL